MSWKLFDWWRSPAHPTWPTAALTWCCATRARVFDMDSDFTVGVWLCSVMS